jgi:aquaporin Z
MTSRRVLPSRKRTATRSKGPVRWLKTSRARPAPGVLTLIHLISIPVTSTSVNPARCTRPAPFAGGWAVEQLWLFWPAPIAGAILGALYKWVVPE